MPRHSFEPYTFDERQEDDKHFFRNSLTAWQKNNPHRLRINSDNDNEIGNAVNFIGAANCTADAGLVLSDFAGFIKLNFQLNDEWKQNCLIPLQVIK